MWAYRLAKADDVLGLLWPISAVRRKLMGRQQEVIETVFQFENDLKIAYSMARSLGWDTTFLREEQCFSMPGPDSTLYGFVITQATSGQRFVISPTPLTFLDDFVDWDACTSTEEMRKTRAALSGDMDMTHPPLKIDDWKRSHKGNMYTSINGAVVTIFPNDRNGGSGFKAVILSPANPDMKVYTRAFQTELEAANHVVQKDNFYNLIRGWTGSSSSSENPFAGIDWGDDTDIPF
jgi:hypothetical protein